MHPELKGKKPPTRDTVLKAIAECRRLGDAAFRANYVDTTPSVTYIHVVHEGERFPIKHIWAASFRPKTTTRYFDPQTAMRGLKKLGFFDFVDLRKDADVFMVEPDPVQREYQEGERRRCEQTYIMRNRGLVAERKRTSDYTCEACGFNFETHYGRVMGEGLIEIHHLFPLSEREGKGPTKLEELAALCANCHRVAHRRNPPYTVEEIRAQFQRPSSRKNLPPGFASG